MNLLNVIVNHVSKLDDAGEECDRTQHEADDRGLYPLVQAQATFTGFDGDPYYVSGCLPCVHAHLAREAHPDHPATIEVGPLPTGAVAA